MDFELLKVGTLVMVIGMGFVFFFLVLMIMAMHVSEKVLAIIAKFCPEEVEEKSQPKRKNTSDDDSNIALAIACALERSTR